MKKIFWFLFALVSCGQVEVGVKEVPVTDEMQFTYLLTPALDSIYRFNPGQDSFQVTMVFNKISAGFPLPDVVTHVDDNFFGQEYAPMLMYTPADYSGDNIINPLGWNFGKGQVFNVAHHNNTLAFLQVDGWVEYTFSGYKIEYHAEQFESYGIAGVSIDNGPETMVDLYSPTNGNNSRVVFTADSLTQDNNAYHKIRVRYTHQRNPNSNNANARITLDKFVTYFRQGTYYKPPAPAPATQQYEQK